MGNYNSQKEQTTEEFKVNKDNGIMAFIAFILIGIIIFYSYNKKRNLEKEGIETKGKIIGLKKGRGKKYFEYVFFVKGKKYKGQVLAKNFNCKNKRRDCKGETSFVIYSPKDPSNNRIDGKYLSLE